MFVDVRVHVSQHCGCCLKGAVTSVSVGALMHTCDYFQHFANQEPTQTLG